MDKDLSAYQNGYESADKSPADIEADIERTRQRISSDLDAISYNLSPQRLRERAQDTLYSAQEAVMSTVQDVTQAVSDKAKETSSSFFELIKENPLPAALIGLGVGLLVTGGATAARSSHEPKGDHDDRYRDVYGDYATTPSEYASNYGDSYGAASSRGDRDMSRSGSRGGLAHWVEEQPLAVGLIALLVGAAVGLGLPGTRYENRVMGETGEELRSRAKGLVSDAVDVVKSTARDLGQEAKQQLSDLGQEAKQQLDERGLSVENAKQAAAKLGEDAKAAAREVGESAKQTFKQEAEKRGVMSADKKDGGDA